MKTTYTEINALLQNEDIEGYISFGAPDDEYSSEAKNIADAINALPTDDRNIKNITDIVVTIWSQSFNLEGEELKLRMQNIQKLINKIIN